MTRKLLGTIAMILALAVVLVGGAGVAYAYWSAGGSGTGFGANGTTTPLTISAGTPTGTLLPGGSTNVLLTMTNPNVARVRISSLALDTTQGTNGFGVDAAHAGCTLSTLSFATQTNGGAGWTVNGKVGTVNGTLAVTLTNALTMSTSAVNACQGATFTVYLLGA
ncbi:MAG TPA: hypothetical protein VGF80_02965 [Galbitalea sp.]|jgi:hypothetical protein